MAHPAPRAPAEAAAPADDDAFWHRLAEAPWAHDLFHVLRRVDARGGSPWRLGRAPLPRAEPVRVRQEPSLAFAPAMLAAARAPADGRPGEVAIHGFGLFGPNGPLPLHLTEHARERMQHHGDRTLADFADIFHQRLALLFYRAWADAEPTVALDRPDEPFSQYVASLLHLGAARYRARDPIGDHARFFMAGRLLRQVRNAEGLASILAADLGLPVRIEPFVAQWLRLPAGQRMRLGGAQPMGRGSGVGAAVRDAQHRFRIELGPMRLERYRDFLPGGAGLERVRQWVRQYVGLEFAWDVRPLLDARDAGGARLGAPRALGLAAWLGTRGAHAGAAGDLLVDAEARAAHPPLPANT